MSLVGFERCSHGTPREVDGSDDFPFQIGAGFEVPAINFQGSCFHMWV